MFGLRLTTADLELRHLTEAGLATPAAILPADAEQDPSLTTCVGLGPAANQAAKVHQEDWRALGTWRPESWATGGTWPHSQPLGQ
jgi:hypothetical protein